MEHVELFSTQKLCEAYCRETGKWIVYMHFDETTETWGDGRAELLKACPILAEQDDSGQTLQTLMDGGGLIVCSDQEHATREYKRIVGDDGPTELNPYDGPARVYALLIGPEGWVDENT